MSKVYYPKSEGSTPIKGWGFRNIIIDLKPGETIEISDKLVESELRKTYPFLVLDVTKKDLNANDKVKTEVETEVKTEDLSWTELRNLGKALKVYKHKINKIDLIKAIESKK